MGNHNKKTEQLHYDAKEWQEVQKTTFYEVMKSKKGQQANLYHFNIKSQRDLQEEADIYHKRRSLSNWVQVIGANLQKSGFGFCGTQQNARVLTERIPYLLNSVQRLNKQQSLVVLYNSLRGYNDISKLIVPESITDRMIGFTSQGQTKVWVNQNFGMNYPSHHHKEAEFNQSQLINDLVNTISPKSELTHDFVNALKNSGSIDNALGFIRNNGGVPESVLESNIINVSNIWGTGQVSAPRDTTTLIQNAPKNNFMQPAHMVSQNYIPGQQFGHSQSVHRNGPVNLAYYNPGGASNFSGGYSKVQPNYRPIGQSVGTNKY